MRKMDKLTCAIHGLNEMDQSIGTRFCFAL